MAASCSFVCCDEETESDKAVLGSYLSFPPPFFEILKMSIISLLTDSVVFG